MNLLITCPGKRVEMVRMFREEFNRFGSDVIATGNSNMLPALYMANRSYIAPEISSEGYIEFLLDICKKENIKGILTMLDADIMILSANIKRFEEIGVVSFIASNSMAKVCDDKFLTYKFLVDNQFNCAKTYNDLGKFLSAYENDEIDFPVFLKPNIGDGSRGVCKINNLYELKNYIEKKDNLIIQQYLDGVELDADVYVDIITGEVVDLFIKRKISTTIGGADKVVSYFDCEVVQLINELCKSLKIRGPIDIDLFKMGNRYYISEINPRLGANYICAHELGVNFCKLIYKNMIGEVNSPRYTEYKTNLYMIKYDKLLVLDKTDIL